MNLDDPQLASEHILAGYRAGCFPMAETRDGPVAWYRPRQRAVITWDTWAIPRSLAKTAKRRPYRLSIDRAFAEVVAACAEIRADTWISRSIEAAYTTLHHAGHAHSVEAWDAEGRLVGGCYGLAVGGCFSGESMFHRAPDASKLCVVTLVAQLQRCGFIALDCQQQSPHMARFGAVEVSAAKYHRLLASCPEDRPWLPPPDNATL